MKFFNDPFERSLVISDTCQDDVIYENGAQSISVMFSYDSTEVECIRPSSSIVSDGIAIVGEVISGCKKAISVGCP